MNSLKEKYGLMNSPRLGPIESFWANPSPQALQRIPKRLQTAEIIDAAIDRYKGDFVFLKHVSGKALTDEQRKRVVSIRGIELRFISERHITYELAQAAVSNCCWALRFVPDALRTEELYEMAIRQNGRSLCLLPESMKTFDLCFCAVNNDHDKDDNNLALEAVPKGIVFGSKGRTLCEAAVKANGLALKAVPATYVDEELAQTAIEHDPNGWSCSAIQFIPSALISERLVDLSLKVSPNSISNLPPSAAKYLTEDKCIEFLRDHPDCVGHLPNRLLVRKNVANYALEQSPRALRSLPEKAKTKTRCFSAKERDPEGVSLSWFPERIREQWEKTHLATEESLGIPEPFTPQTDIKKLPLPESPIGHLILAEDAGHLVAHQFGEALSGLKRFCYVSDIHLEHQLAFGKCKLKDEAAELIKNKVGELVSSLPRAAPYVLLAGDIADSMDLAKLFYESLVSELDKRQARTIVVSVLGNHELWDNSLQGGNGNSSIEQIIENHRKALKAACDCSAYVQGVILENDLLVLHKGRRYRVIREEDIIQSSHNDLKELCSESAVLILGGLGYSGLNPKFNASMGLYRGTVSPEEDAALSERFRTVHDKLAQCAGEKRVIVLTHSPIQNWLPRPPSNNWVYINGHTHLNGLSREQDGPTLLFDNQIGYEPKTWHFNSVELEGRYDPFESWKDGVYEITAEQYKDFNRGRGIYSEFNRAGKPYVAKREGVYMFFLVNNGKPYRLEGGRIYTVNHPIAWYYNNMPLYTARVCHAFKPYQNALKRISEEVKSFGGYGIIHGCIVDIDFFSHVYLNPFNGAIIPYFAWDTESREEFDSVENLLAARALFLGASDQDHMFQAYVEQERLGNLALLSSRSIEASQNSSIAIPEEMLDRSMYEPSRIMRSIQYLFDDNVIRIWRDSVLEGTSEPVEHIPTNEPKEFKSGNSLPATLETH